MIPLHVQSFVEVGLRFAGLKNNRGAVLGLEQSQGLEVLEAGQHIEDARVRLPLQPDFGPRSGHGEEEFAIL